MSHGTRLVWSILPEDERKIAVAQWFPFKLSADEFRTRCADFTKVQALDRDDVVLVHGLRRDAQHRLWFIITVPLTGRYLHPQPSTQLF